MGDIGQKIIFAIILILFTCVVYLMNALSTLQTNVNTLQAKVQIVVSADNKQVTNLDAALAREKLRQDLLDSVQEINSRASQNRARIDVLEKRLDIMERTINQVIVPSVKQ
jgi:predicted Holliday junction resolvase-like endonuclease